MNAFFAIAAVDWAELPINVFWKDAPVEFNRYWLVDCHFVYGWGGY